MLCARVEQAVRGSFGSVDHGSLALFEVSYQSPPRDNCVSFITGGVAGSQVTLCGEWYHVKEWRVDPSCSFDTPLKK